MLDFLQLYPSTVMKLLHLLSSPQKTNLKGEVVLYLLQQNNKDICESWEPSGIEMIPSLWQREKDLTTGVEPPCPTWDVWTCLKRIPAQLKQTYLPLHHQDKHSASKVEQCLKSYLPHVSMLKFTLRRAMRKKLQNPRTWLQFMAQSWAAWHGMQSPALYIPHSSQAPGSPAEVWLEQGLQAIAGNKTSDNSALRVQRGALFLRIASLVIDFSTSCKIKC